MVINEPQRSERWESSLTIDFVTHSIKFNCLCPSMFPTRCVPVQCPGTAITNVRENLWSEPVNNCVSSQVVLLS